MLTRSKATVLLIASLLSACSETPTGRQQLALIPPDMLSDLGRTTFNEMKSTLPISTDGAANRQVTCVATALMQVIDRQYPAAYQPTAFEVVVFDDPTANAFALPGGQIGVFTGMLDVAETQHQLAAVIGHEIAHVLASHGNERMTQQLGINGVLLLIGLFTEIDSAVMLRAMGLGAHYGITLPFSRAHEAEADVMGLTLMAVAGFDPEGSIELWENMAARAADAPPEFLSTHPGIETRINLLQENLENAVQLQRNAGHKKSCDG